MRKPFIFIFAMSAGMMAAAWAWQARAQSTLPDQSLMFNPNSLQQQPAPQAAKQRPVRSKAAPQAAPQAAATKRTARPPSSRAATPAPRDTLPRLTVKDPQQAPAQPMLGRIPWDTGTFGISTGKQYSTSVFSDGRVTPGFENIQTKDPSYFGLSLSVPTDKSSIIPLPFLSRPD